jgi:L-lactate utilization protein LutC
MPGFMQFITGVYLFLGLTLFGTFKDPLLYAAALAFTAYGVHWLAIGWNRLRRADARANVGMTVAFMFISILGIIVFFKGGDEGSASSSAA